MSVKLTDETYRGFTENGVCLVDVWAEWCGPCKQIGPLIDELATELTNVKVGKLDADQNPDTLSRLGVRSIPTILIYKNGSVVEKHVGVATKSQLVDLVNKHLS